MKIEELEAMADQCKADGRQIGPLDPRIIRSLCILARQADKCNADFVKLVAQRDELARLCEEAIRQRDALLASASAAVCTCPKEIQLHHPNVHEGRCPKVRSPRCDAIADHLNGACCIMSDGHVAKVHKTAAGTTWPVKVAKKDVPGTIDGAWNPTGVQ